MKEKKQTSTNIVKNKTKMPKKIINLISDIVYVCILVPLVFIAIHIVFIAITKPDVIPDIFGYKIFIILNDNMNESIDYGDLVLTKNVDTNSLVENDVMDFRNSMNTVTIQKINEISQITEVDEETKEEKNTKVFLMNTFENEKEDTAIVREEKVEGKLVYAIPKLGEIIYFIQQPLAMLGIECIIFSIGLICIYIAEKLDERDTKKL